MGAGCLLIGSARETLTYESLHFTRFGQREKKLSCILTEHLYTDLIVRKNFCLRDAEFSSGSLVAAAPATILSGWKLEPCIFGLSPEFCALFSHRNLSEAIFG